MYTLAISRNADKDLAALSPSFRQIIIRKINSLLINPRPHGVKKLKGEQDQYRVRVGDYRIVYEIKDSILLIIVIRVRHRKEVY